jgi:glycosyltransferase involved in cell wall biosynthesis
MKILHLAAGNRWTGAAAPAFAEVEALRAAGVDAHYAYVGGYLLEEKLAHCDFAHPLIEKAQNPLSFRRSVRALNHIIERYGFDVLHAHLTHDHWLARFATRSRKIRLARTFHARRTLRSDPFTKSVLGRTEHVFIVNDAFRDAPLLRSRTPLFTPPPVDHRQFTPDGPNARATYGIAADTTVVVSIGKIARERGFEDALHAFSIFRRMVSNSKMMIIGHGPHRPALEAFSRDLGIADHVIWTGYHENDLAEHYRAGDLLFFTAAGSDEGHRAVLEGMACGVIPIAMPLPGMHSLTGDLSSALVTPESSTEQLARVASETLENKEVVRSQVIARSQAFSYAAAARTLLRGYES